MQLEILGGSGGTWKIIEETMHYVGAMPSAPVLHLWINPNHVYSHTSCHTHLFKL